MKKLLITLSAIILSASTILTGCGSAKSAENAADVYLNYEEAKPTASSGNYYGFGSWTVNRETSSSFADDSLSDVLDVIEESETIEPTANRKIIYTSNYSIETTEFEQAIAVLDSLCQMYGAYYEKSETFGTKEIANRNSSFTVRVPVQNYNAFKAEAGSIGIITRSSENNRDVTEVYIDTEARLQSAKIREERLLEILANADSLDDVLLLEKELADVRYEIESMSGSLRKYDSLISYSTIVISIRETIEPIEIKAVPKTFSEKVSSSLSDGFDDFSRDAGYLFLDILYNLPGIIIFIVTIVIICVIIKLIIKKAKNKKAKASKKEKIEEVKESETKE